MQASPIPAPSLSHKIKRMIWSACWLLLYRPSPVMLHSWRRFLLRCFGADIRAGAHPYPSARIWAPWNLTMLEEACLGPHSDCYNAAHVTIGKKAIVSQKSYLCTPSHEANDAFQLVAAPIVLEDRAWVAACALITPGVTIGRGAVVGAGSVVTKDVAAGVIVAGNPARQVGTSDLGKSNAG
nr:putative colanic acid biosynthesis acetyltransferase [Aurantiacibacter sp. MUD61]